MLEMMKEVPLSIITATAGWGKTTALRSFFNARRLRCAWIALNSGSELVFWEKLCRGCAEFSKSGAAALAEISIPKSDVQAARVLDILSGDFAGDFYIVIDDYHLLAEDSPVHDLIRSIALNEPLGLHFVLISRSTPPLNAVELSAKGLAFVVTGRELAFTPDETEGFLVSRGLKLTKKTVFKIHCASSGWASAIFLMSVGIQNGLGASETTEIDRLINENFIAPLDEETQSMLISLSSLEVFTERQAVYVVRSEKVMDVIRRMAKYNALTAVDSQGQYNFHYLLQEYLAKRRTPAVFQEACRRAASWLIENGKTGEALHYWYKAGEYETILRALDRPIHPYRRFVGVFRVGGFFASMDNESMCVKYPFPYLHLIFFSLISGIGEHRALASRLLEIMEEHFKNAEAGHRDRILGECLVLRYIQSHSVGVRLNFLKAAKSLFGDEKSELLLKNDPFTFALPALLYSMFKMRGSLDKTVEYLQDRALEDVTDGLGHGKDRLALAEAAIERCAAGEAVKSAEQALLMARDSGQAFIAAAAAFVMIRAALYEGKSSEAMLWLEKIRGFPDELNAGFDDFNRASYADLTDAAEGYMYACLAMAERIPLPLKAAREHGGLMKNGYGFFSLIRARAALLMGRFGDAETICGNCFVELEREFCQLGMINAKITLSAAKYGLGDHMEAAKILSEAIMEAEADCVVMPFAENYSMIRPVLDDICEKRMTRSDFLVTVVKACRKNRAHCSASGLGHDIHLSTRELEALSLAAHGRTQREIAEAMGVQEVTAKKHLISSYKKLGASNRITAVKIAASKGLITSDF